MKPTLLLLVLLWSAPAHAQLTSDGWPLHLALGGYMTLDGVDLSESMYVIGAQRGHEVNPIFAPFSNRPILFGAAKIGLDSAVVYTLLRIHQQHPRLTWVLTTLGISLETYVSIHNAHLLPPVR